MQGNLYYIVGNSISNPFKRPVKRPAASCMSGVITLLVYIIIVLVCVVVVLVWSLLAYINQAHLLPSWSILTSYNLQTLFTITIQSYYSNSLAPPAIAIYYHHLFNFKIHNFSSKYKDPKDLNRSKDANLVNKMSEILVSTTKYSGCPSTCNTTTRALNQCLAARASGTNCPNPPEKPMGQTKSRTQCPNHVDEGYGGSRPTWVDLTISEFRYSLFTYWKR